MLWLFLKYFLSICVDSHFKTPKTRIEIESNMQIKSFPTRINYAYFENNPAANTFCIIATGLKLGNKT